MVGNSARAMQKSGVRIADRPSLLLKGSGRVNRILGPKEDLTDLAKSVRLAKRQRGRSEVCHRPLHLPEFSSIGFSGSRLLTSSAGVWDEWDRTLPLSEKPDEKGARFAVLFYDRCFVTRISGDG
jgi:hypothetical protein